MKREIITLSNGKRVGNFSSPHDFTFTDGSILPAVSDADAEALKVTFEETDYGNGDIGLDFELSETVTIAMISWENLWREGKIDVVFCPLPMITAMKRNGEDILDSPFRTIRMEDRIKKLISIDKQCI